MASGGVTPAHLTPQSNTPTSTPISNLNPNASSLPNGTTSTSSHKESEALNTPKKVKICVFCGSSPGTSPAHMSAARSLAQVMAAHNIALVFGGGTSGIMGEIARTLVSLSGPDSVHGIIPAPLVKYERGPDSEGVSSHGAKELLPDYEVFGRTTVVKDMHTRKHLMAREVLEGAEGSGFVALSGGYGTLEELMEVVTWNQLGIHSRGVCVYNVEGYWDGLLEWANGAVKAGFVKQGSRGILGEGKDAEECVTWLKEFRGVEGRMKLDWEQN